MAANLLSSGIIGPAGPTLAKGIGAGIAAWVPQVLVVTIDSGTAGGGSGQAPLTVPMPNMIQAMLASYAINGQLGPMSPLEAMGVAKGVTSALATGILKTSHIGVGSGTGVAKFIAPPAYQSLIQAFKAAGMTGPLSEKKAKAISDALLLIFTVLSAPIPIVGAASTSPGSGTGVGRIL